MASPAYRSSVLVGGGTSNLIEFTPPTGLANNDIMLAWIYYESNSAVTITPPAGFAEYTAAALDNTTPDPDFHVRLFWKRAASESGNYAFNLSATIGCYGTIAAYSGAVTTGTPIQVSDKTTGSGNCTLPSISALTAETLVIGAVSSYSWVITWSTSALTERLDHDGHEISDAAQAGTGASGTKLLTASGTDQFAGMILSLASVAGGPSDLNVAVVPSDATYAVHSVKVVG